jgi:hypothetical protein
VILSCEATLSGVVDAVKSYQWSPIEAPIRRHSNEPLPVKQDGRRDPQLWSGDNLYYFWQKTRFHHLAEFVSKMLGKHLEGLRKRSTSTFNACLPHIYDIRVSKVAAVVAMHHED